MLGSNLYLTPSLEDSSKSLDPVKLAICLGYVRNSGKLLPYNIIAFKNIKNQNYIILYNVL
jgi:hypothetical protein